MLFALIKTAVFVVGFERTNYAVTESDGTVEVCVLAYIKLIDPVGGL